MTKILSYISKTEYKVPFIYLILSILWIIFSDMLLFNYISSTENTKIISVTKGLVFVVLTALTFYFLIKKDVNRIRAVNENLKLSNDYYYSLFKNNHFASLLVNPDSLQIIDANDAAANLYGYSRETLMNMELSDLSVSSISKNINFTDFDATGLNQIFMNSSHRTASDNLIEVELFMGPVYLQDRLCLLALINDITAKNSTENALKDSEQKYKKLVENIPDVFYVYSMKKGLQYISPQIKSLIGYIPAKSDNLPDIILNHVFPDDKANFLAGRKTVFDTFEPLENNYRITDSNKITKWILDRVFLITPIDDDILIEGVLSDTTEKRKLVEGLVLAHTKANESLKLKNVILSNLNHELRTPLNGIIGFSKLIQKSSKEPEIQEYIDLVLESSYRLNSTLNSLLTLNEIEAGHRELYFEESSIKDYLGLIYYSNTKQVQRKRLDFVMDVREDMKFYTDISILSQVFFNLIDNAVKFTDEGKITLRGEFVTKGGMWIRLSVIDTGIGINPDYFKDIFQPFRQESEGMSRKFEGMGIGLTICYKLIALLKGKIEVESTPEKGSSFMVYLPFKIPDYSAS